jgi:putative DNA methylase
VLFASLVDDPESDPQAAQLSGETREAWIGTERQRLHALIDDLVLWENSNNPTVINAARAEIARCVASRKIELGELTKDQIIFGDKKGQKHSKGPVSGEGVTAWEVLLRKARPEVVNAFLVEHAPPVLDPFCGGGSIPLEAQRLGLRAYASDLNPVPVLITKALIEIPPKFAGQPPVNPEWQKKSAAEKAATVWEGAQGLAEDVLYYGKWMRDEAEKRIGHLYPKVKITAEMVKDRPDLKEYVGEELTVIAWLWARTVASPNPAFQGIHVPLISSFWLGTKPSQCAWLRPAVDRAGKKYKLTVHIGTPGADEKRLIDDGTKLGRGCKFRCLLSDQPIPEDYVKGEGMAGRMGAAPIALVADAGGRRIYLTAPPPNSSAPELRVQAADLGGIDSPIALDKRAIWCLLYGLTSFDRLFTARQIILLTTCAGIVIQAKTRVTGDIGRVSAPETGGVAEGYADAIATYLGLAVSKAADYNSALVSWITPRNQARNTFARQGLPMVWDFCEVNPFAKAAGDVEVSLDGIAEVLKRLVRGTAGRVTQLDAAALVEGTDHPVICTDPPYYDNIGYADLSDFFYVWLRRALKGIYASVFATALTPKVQELIASPYRHGGDKGAAQGFFESGLGCAFARMHDSQANAYPATVYYAFKQSETDEDHGNDAEPASPRLASTGWETMLAGLIRSGFSITGTWPMRTERSTRSVSLGTNALASSIVLVCRRRAAEARLGTRKEFIDAMRVELPPALQRLQRGNIAPVDMAQSAIGPGMAVFTRFSRVMESDGTPMSVRTALGLINQTLDEVLAEQEGEFDGDTRWALAWFEQFGVEEGPFGVAEVLSKAKDTAVNGMVEAGVVVARAGKVRLVRRDELPETWDPATDGRLTIWETTQHLIRTLDKQGESAAAALMHKLGGMAEIARDLAYRLYTVCERKKWAEEALAYNGLVIAWPELTKLAHAERTRVRERQRELM